MKTTALLLSVTCLLAFSHRSMAETPVEWLIAPYGWLPDVGLERRGALPDDDAGAAINGSDLLDKTDAAGMIRIEAARHRWGLLLDYIFLDLSESTVLQTPGPLIPDIGIRAGLDLTVVELGAMYRASGGEEGVHYLLGYRRIDADTSLRASIDGVGTLESDGSAGLDDVFLGARYIHRVNQSWDVTVRGDYSFGESEGVVNLLASVGYRFHDKIAVQGGYRHVVLEYEQQQDDATVNTQIELSGPFVGVVFRF